jgi:hypothetical protein
MINVSTTCTQAVVRIEEVLAPKYVLPIHKCSLEDLKGTSTTFEAVVHISSLRTCNHLSPVASDATQLPAEIEIVSVIYPPEHVQYMQSMRLMQIMTQNQKMMQNLDFQMLMK